MSNANTPATGTGSVNPTTIGATTTVTYTGHELIAGAGLINMGARLYDPATGLFMSPDPIVADPYNTQDLNQYAYVNDNPLTYTDPTGLVTILSKIYVDGYCDIYCVMAGMSSGVVTVGSETNGLKIADGGNHGSGNGLKQKKQAKKKQCNKNLIGAPAPVVTAAPSGTGSNGLDNFSRLYNPNLQRNILAGAGMGGLMGTLFFGGVILLAAPEAAPELLPELFVHGSMVALTVGGGTGAVIGGAVGYALTKPKSSPGLNEQCPQ